ncbi:hypothetical protein QI357_01520 [Staphylococcus saprophyticus]|nr:hypothetical protein [Staphylococcus saprophyticus]MDW3796459.1 hypothetical protein [Staphylococcus saprophyticus]
MRNTVKNYEKLSEQYNKMLEERNSLIDDLSWYKAKVNRLEREKEKLKEIKQEKEQLEESFQYQLEKRLEYFTKCKELKQENKALRLQSNIYFDELQESEKQRSEFVTMLNESNNLLSEFSQHIGNKPSSSTYKYFREKLDNLNITEDK